jgi:periplasmic protein TonB
MDANRTLPVYELKDELARHCLPPANRDPNRKLAWVNSICILFLIIGVAGAKRGSITLKPPPPLPAEMVPIFVETPPPPASDETPKEEPKEAKPEAPNMVVAVPDSPAVLFSVPTIANVLVPDGVPTTPPENPMRPVEALRSRPATLISSGGFERPAPDYPAYFLDLGEHGSVTFLITVNQSGLVTDVKVAHSSGFPDLDEYALKHVKKRWIIPPKDGNQIFQTTINFVP